MSESAETPPRFGERMNRYKSKSHSNRRIVIPYNICPSPRFTPSHRTFRSLRTFRSRPWEVGSFRSWRIFRSHQGWHLPLARPRARPQARPQARACPLRRICRSWRISRSLQQEGGIFRNQHTCRSHRETPRPLAQPRACPSRRTCRSWRTFRSHPLGEDKSLVICQ